MSTKSLELTSLGFETARLAVRLLSLADEEMYCSLYTDSETMRYIAAPLSAGHAVQSFRKAVARSTEHPGSSRIFAILEKAACRPVGLCGVQQVDVHARSAELGMILKKEVRDRGYASEALPALVTATFAHFPIGTVWVQYSPEHMAAERLVVGIGFKTCTRPETGNPVDAKCVWSIDRLTWSSIYAANHRGEDDVERDQLSRTAGTGRNAASRLGG